MATELTPTVNLQGYFTQETFVVVLFWIVFILGITLVLVTLGFFIWYSTYKIRIRYYQVIGKAEANKELIRFIGTDKAKLIKTPGNIAKLRFFWKRRKIEPPPDEAYTPTKKGYEMFIKTNGVDFDPLVFRVSTNPGAVVEYAPMHKRLWLIQTHKQAIEQYSKPTFWEKYGTLILTFGTIILCLGAMAFTIWYAAKVASQAINSYAPSIAEAARSRVVAPGS